MTTITSPVSRVSRLASVDIVRGAVMVLMAIDHVRVYSGVPAGGPSFGVFFTRWVTHFCAPAFVFLAGTGAYLHLRKTGDRGAMARYLVTRGLMLVVLELTVIRASWTFGVDYSQFILAGVIWMLGWCMVLLAGLIFLPTPLVGAIGLAVIIGQGVFGRLPPAAVSQFIYLGEDVKLGTDGPSVTVLYTIVPWIGVMAAGYAFGSILTREASIRRRLCLRIGLFATAAFLTLGVIQVIAGPAPESAAPALMRLLNQQKYPASQMFLLMTLGPTIALLPFAERAKGRIAEMLAVFGRVPMFYYLLHIPTIHAVSMLVWFLRDGTAHADWFATAPYVSVPPDQRWGLPLLYLVFIVCVVILYFPCRWYAQLKQRSDSGWLRYI
jgi:uncharacterized membrane protein